MANNIVNYSILEPNNLTFADEINLNLFFIINSDLFDIITYYNLLTYRLSP
jgi:hypothetical protein